MRFFSSVCLAGSLAIAIAASAQTPAIVVRPEKKETARAQLQYAQSLIPAVTQVSGLERHRVSRPLLAALGCAAPTRCHIALALQFRRRCGSYSAVVITTNVYHYDPPRG